MKKKILIIDDDSKLCDLLTSYLNRYGFNTESKNTPSAGLLKINKFQPDLIILDVMLPEMDGFETLKQIRKATETPVVMLTARGDTMDKIVGLELGADDYLPKPFEPRELLARIQTVLRRFQRTPSPDSDKSTHYASGNLTLDVERREAYLAGEDLELTSMEFEILLLLMSNSARVISRDDIMEEIRGIDWEAYNRSIDVAVSRLRTKLKDDAKRPNYIKTVWGKGYQFIGEVTNNA